MLRHGYSANDSFLGVVEDELASSVGRHSMKVSVNIEEFKKKSEPVIKQKTATEIYNKLIRGGDAYKDTGIALDLIFTKTNVWEALKSKGSIQVIKVLDIDEKTYQLTTLEVRVPGIDRPMVLKCIECQMRTTDSDRVVTVAQQEVSAYDRLPGQLKDLFVEKFAHGRLWFKSSSYEVLLMEGMSDYSLDQGFTQTGFSSANNDHFVWLAQAFGMLHKVHAAGYSHGNAHAGNVKWSEGPGKGALKFVGLARVVNISTNENEVKSIRKLNDICHLLLDNNLSFSGLNPRRLVREINFGQLHARLVEIKTRLAASSVGSIDKYFSLDETLPYHADFIDAEIYGIRETKAKLESADSMQYQRMKDPSFQKKLDDFTLSLTDPEYLRKVFLFVIAQINRSTQNAAVDQDDMKIPLQKGLFLPQSRPPVPSPPAPAPVPVLLPQQIPVRPLTPIPPPLPRPASLPGGGAINPSGMPPFRPGGSSLPGTMNPAWQPLVPPQVPNPPGPSPGQPIYNGNVSGNHLIPFPLMFDGYIIQLFNGREFLEIFYTIDRNGVVSLKVPNHSSGRFDSISDITLIRELHAEGKLMFTSRSEELYFNINPDNNTLVVYTMKAAVVPPYSKKPTRFDVVPLVPRIKQPTVISNTA